MPSFQYGVKRGINAIMLSIILLVSIRVILGAYNLEYLVILFDVVSILLIILLIDKMKYWSIGYSFGWIIGVLMFYTILTPLEILLYCVVFIVAISLKFTNKIKRYF